MYCRPICYLFCRFIFRKIPKLVIILVSGKYPVVTQSCNRSCTLSDLIIKVKAFIAFMTRIELTNIFCDAIINFEPSTKIWNYYS